MINKKSKVKGNRAVIKIGTGLKNLKIMEVSTNILGELIINIVKCSSRRRRFL